MSNLLKVIGNAALNGALIPIKHNVINSPTTRTIALSAAGFALGGPVGAAAGATIASGINSAEQGKKAGKIANKGLAMQADQAKSYATYQARLNKQLGSEESKTQSALAKGSRGKIKGGVFGPVSETPKGPQATLG